MRFPILIVISAVAVGACQSPTDPLAEMTAPEVRAEAEAISATIVADAGDPNRRTYTFDDLSQNCGWNVTTANLYEDLAFPSLPFLSPCPTTNGTMGVRPSREGVASLEVRVGLPESASAVSIEVYRFSDGDIPMLIAYDSTGAVIGQASDSTLNAWATLEIAGGGTPIVKIGLLMPQLRVDMDNLTVTYGTGAGDPGADDPADPGDEPTGPGEARADPQTKPDCTQGGWEQFGFRNQGQCVRFVETDNDSRDDTSSES